MKAEPLLSILRLVVDEMFADAKGPLALQLSGGLDSAILSALGPFPHSYVVTWPEMDNAVMASAAHRGPGHLHVLTFSREQMIEEALPEVARLTRGRGSWSQCCQWYMAQAAARDGAWGIVNGEAADELFGGYARYRVLYWLDRMRADPHLEEYQGFCDLVSGTRDENVRRCCRAPMMDVAVIDPGDAGARMSDVAAYWDDHVELAALLRFEDSIAADAGLVHFHPFGDSRVRDFASELDEEDLISERESKAILRDVARLLNVNPAIVNEQTKRGLVVPPDWAPPGERKWSRAWFDTLMAQEWSRQVALGGSDSCHGQPLQMARQV